MWYILASRCYGTGVEMLDHYAYLQYHFKVKIDNQGNTCIKLLTSAIFQKLSHKCHCNLTISGRYAILEDL